MQTRADFASQNTILFSARILADSVAKRDFSAGWSQPLQTPAADVIDLNGNGQADFVVDDGEKHRDDRNHTIALQEPALYAPRLSALKAFATGQGAEVLTQDDLPNGVFVQDLGVRGGEEGPGTPVTVNVRPLQALVAAHDPYDPAAKFAIDVSSGEFLIYKPTR